MVTGPSCPAGMTQDPSTKRCYIYVKTTKTQDAAMAYCAALHPGVHLVDLQTQEEYEFVNALAKEACHGCKYGRNVFKLFVCCVVRRKSIGFPTKQH